MSHYPAKKKRKSVNNVIEGEFSENSGKRKKQNNNQHNEDQKAAQTNCLKIKPEQLRKFEPLTDKQRTFFDAYDDGEEFIGLFGSAGTGKTFIAVYKALQEVLDKGNPYHQLVIVRSEVQGRESGFMPGSKEEKAALFEAPYLPMCASMFSRGDAYQRLKEQKFIRFETTVAIRGLTFDNSIIVVDEAQNMNWDELSTIVTRIGENSKIIFCGDIKQDDLNKRKGDVTGLPTFLRVASRMNEFYPIEFGRDDIVRSALCKSWIIACEDEGI
jgi:predicted ribonuclease YlaK